MGMFNHTQWPVYTVHHSDKKIFDILLDTNASVVCNAGSPRPEELLGTKGRFFYLNIVMHVGGF